MYKMGVQASQRLQDSSLAFLLQPRPPELDDAQAAARIMACAQTGVDLNGWWSDSETWLMDIRTGDTAQVQVARTAAQMVAVHGDLRWLAPLQQAGADLHAFDGLERTSLMVAVLHQNAAAVDALLGLGADIEARNNPGMGKGHLSETALMRAVSMGYTDMVNLLADRGANLNVQDTELDRECVLARAIRGKQEAAALELIRRGARLHKTGGWDLNNLLYEAVNSDSPTVVHALLEAGVPPVVSWNGTRKPLEAYMDDAQRPRFSTWLRAREAARVAHETVDALQTCGARP